MTHGKMTIRERQKHERRLHTKKLLLEELLDTLEEIEKVRVERNKIDFERRSALESESKLGEQIKTLTRDRDHFATRSTGLAKQVRTAMHSDNRVLRLERDSIADSVNLQRMALEQIHDDGDPVGIAARYGNDNWEPVESPG